MLAFQIISFYLVKNCLYRHQAHGIQHAGRSPGEAQQIIICHLCSSSVIYAVLLYNTFKIHTYFSLTKHLHVGVNHSCIARTVAT